MLDQIARHGLIDLDIEAEGDLHIDAHHTVEDIGYYLGQACGRRWATSAASAVTAMPTCRLDEALSRWCSTAPGRPGRNISSNSPAPDIGGFDVDLFREFFQGFVNHAHLITCTVDNLRGRQTPSHRRNRVKAFGAPLRMAVEPDPRTTGVPSTKGQPVTTAILLRSISASFPNDQYCDH